MGTQRSCLTAWFFSVSVHSLNRGGNRSPGRGATAPLGSFQLRWRCESLSNSKVKGACEHSLPGDDLRLSNILAALWNLFLFIFFILEFIGILFFLYPFPPFLPLDSVCSTYLHVSNQYYVDRICITAYHMTQRSRLEPARLGD